MSGESAAAAIPTEADAARLLERLTGRAVVSLTRFPTGLAHFVYDARSADGASFVVRLTRPEQRGVFAGFVYWHSRLRPLGVPLPALLHVDLDGELTGFPALVMERLPGTDLGAVYGELSEAEKRALASEVVAIQRRVATLPQATGYGFALSYDQASAPSWRAVLDGQLARARRWMGVARAVDTGLVDRVAEAMSRNEAYFGAVRPVPFLDDLTTKNVIVAGGRLSGVVDIDVVCFGDPLFTPALTSVALRSAEQDTRYVEYWLVELDLDPRPAPRLHALHRALRRHLPG